VLQQWNRSNRSWIRWCTTWLHNHRLASQNKSVSGNPDTGGSWPADTNTSHRIIGRKNGNQCHSGPITADYCRGNRRVWKTQI
jgi:hypothetical protein